MVRLNVWMGWSGGLQDYSRTSPDWVALELSPTGSTDQPQAGHVVDLGLAWEEIYGSFPVVIVDEGEPVGEGGAPAVLAEGEAPELPHGSEALILDASEVLPVAGGPGSALFSLRPGRNFQVHGLQSVAEPPSGNTITAP